MSTFTNSSHPRPPWSHPQPDVIDSPSEGESHARLNAALLRGTALPNPNSATAAAAASASRTFHQEEENKNQYQQQHSNNKRRDSGGHNSMPTATANTNTTVNAGGAFPGGPLQDVVQSPPLQGPNNATHTMHHQQHRRRSSGDDDDDSDRNRGELEAQLQQQEQEAEDRLLLLDALRRREDAADQRAAAVGKNIATNSNSNNNLDPVALQIQLDRLLEDNSALAQKADRANKRCQELEFMLETERNRHAVNDMRVGDMELEVERLSRRLQGAEDALSTRDSELRTLEIKLADMTELHAREFNERRVAVEQERHRADLCADQVRSQRDAIDRLDDELAHAVKSRNDAQRTLSKQQEAVEALKREAHGLRRQLDSANDRVRTGALVDARALREADTVRDQLHADLQVLQANNRRLLTLLMASKEFGPLIQSDHIGEGFVYCGSAAPMGASGLHRSIQAAELRDAIIAENALSRNSRSYHGLIESRGPSQLPLFMDAEGGAAAAAGEVYLPKSVQQAVGKSSYSSATIGGVLPWRGQSNSHDLFPGQLGGGNANHHKPEPVVCRHREKEWWIPKASFDVATAFRNHSLPGVPMDVFYPFFVQLNSVWHRRLEDKMKAFEQLHASKARFSARVVRHRSVSPTKHNIRLISNQHHQQLNHHQKSSSSSLLIPSSSHALYRYQDPSSIEQGGGDGYAQPTADVELEALRRDVQEFFRKESALVNSTLPNIQAHMQQRTLFLQSCKRLVQLYDQVAALAIQERATAEAAVSEKYVHEKSHDDDSNQLTVQSISSMQYAAEVLLRLSEASQQQSRDFTLGLREISPELKRIGLSEFGSVCEEYQAEVVKGMAEVEQTASRLQRRAADLEQSLAVKGRSEAWMGQQRHHHHHH